MNLEQDFTPGELTRLDLFEPQHFRGAEFFKDNGFQSVVTLKGWCWAHDPEIRGPNKKLRELSPISSYWPNDLKKPLFSSSL
jgi:hypothetical protein